MALPERIQSTNQSKENLSQEQLLDLLAQIREADSLKKELIQNPDLAPTPQTEQTLEKGVAAQNTLFQKFKKLAYFLVYKIYPNPPEDFFQQALLHLLEAIHEAAFHYDPKKGALTSYIYQIIQSRLSHYTVQENNGPAKIPKNLITFVIPKIEEKLPPDTNILDLSPEEIQKITKLNLSLIKTAQKAQRIRKPLSLDILTTHNPESSFLNDIVLSDFLSDESPSPEQQAIANITQEDRKTAINNLFKNAGLTDTEQKIIEEKFGLEDGQGKTFQEIGENHSRTRQWAHLVAKGAFEKINNFLEENPDTKETFRQLLV